MRENDIVFFNLHRRYLDRAPDYGGFLGIYILAAFVNENGYRGQAFEGTLKAGLKLVDELCQKKKIHILGLYCDYANVTENQYISQYVKGKYGIPVFVGGPQATSLKADFMCLSKCDVIVRYEGELTVLELMDFFLDGTGTLANILGIAYCMDNKFVVNPNRPEIENLDALPFISDECYLETRKNQYELSIMTGRGCPFHCSFCHEGHHTRKVRFRSIENVLAEIDMFIQSKPPESNCYILFTDDTFTLDELWQATLIGSSNKAVLSLANALDWPMAAFVERMNQKALELGMTETSFTDPSGLDDTDVSTPSDLSFVSLSISIPKNSISLHIRSLIIKDLSPTVPAKIRRSKPPRIADILPICCLTRLT